MAQTPADRRRPASGSTTRIQAQQSQAAGTPPLGDAWELGTLSPLGSPIDNLRQTRPQLSNTVTLNGRTYREIDNGKAGVLVPIQESGASQVARTQQRRAIERVQIMANSPLAGAAYALTSLASAPQQARDRALAMGATADTIIGSNVPRTPRLRQPTAPSQPVPVVPLDGSIRLRELNSKGQAQGVNASIGATMLRTGTKARRSIEPPGWQGDGDLYNEGRAHLLARQLGGSGSDRRNIVTMTQHPTNDKDMAAFEHRVARNIQKGDIVEYSATPLYGRDSLPPKFVLMTAHGTQSGFSGRLVRNPAGQRK